MITISFYGDWNQAIGNSKGKQRTVMLGFLDKAVQEGAQKYVKEVKKGIVAQSPAGKAFIPLRPLTTIRKMSNKALLDTGDLIHSIKVHRVSGFSYFAGVSRTARGRKRKYGSRGGLMNIAAVHELGKIFKIRITVKMFRWFFVMLAAAYGRASRLQGKRPGVFPTGPSAPGGHAIPSFKPGAMLKIIIRPRPYLRPVFDRDKSALVSFVRNRFKQLCAASPILNP